MAITAETRTGIIEVVVGMFDAAPGAAVLSELTSIVDAGTSLRDLTVALADSSVFKAAYPNFLTNEEFSTNFLTNILGGNVTQEILDEAVDIAVAELNAGMSRADLVWLVIDFLGNVAEDDPNLGTAATEFNNKVEVAEYYSVDLNLSADTLEALENVIGNVDATEASVTSAKSIADGTSTEGETFTLTTGVDEILGTKNDDTIQGTDTTITGLDTVDGGEGDDSFNISDVNGAAVKLTNLTSVKNVETLSLTSTTGLNGGAANISGWTGLETAVIALNASAAATTVTVAAGTDLTLQNAGSGGFATAVNGGNDVTVTAGTALGDTVTITGGGTTTGLNTATVTGGTTVAINDAAKDTLTSASITGNAGAATITSDNLTELTLASSNQNATVTAAAGTRDLTINTNGMTGGVVQDNTATSVSVNNSGTATTGVTLTAGAATSVALSATGKSLTLADVNIGSATKLTVSGDAAVTVSATSGVGALTAVDATESTGGVTITPALGTGVTFTGGDGKDSITLGASTKANTTGGGDDTVTLSGAALGAKGTVDAGEGTDTLSMTAANAATATGSAAFEATIAGFEAVTLTGGGTNTVDLANLDDISNVVTAGNTALTLNNMASGGSITYTAADTATNVNLVPTAVVATDDSFNITATANAAAINIGTITVPNTESIAITTDDSAAAPGGVQHTATLTAAAAENLTVAGDAGIVLTLTGSVALANIDTSGVTKGAVSVTTVADVSTTFVGGDTATTVSLAGITTATNTGSITTGAGNDIVTGGAGADQISTGEGTSTINAGGGDDTITTGSKVDNIDGQAGADTINAGDGNDIITGGAGADTLTGGDGADQFTYTAAAESNGVNQDTITDFVSGTDKIDTATAATYLGEAAGYGAVLTSLTGTLWDAVLDSQTSTLYIDVDGDAALTNADISIALTGVTELAVGDFM